MLLPNNAEHQEAEKLKHMLRKMCQKHGADPETASVSFGDNDGRLSFSLLAPMNKTGQMLVMNGTLTPVSSSEENYPNEFQN